LGWTIVVLNKSTNGILKKSHYSGV